MSKKSKVSKSTARSAETGSVRRRTRMIALEPRMLFDGALGVDLAAQSTAVAKTEAPPPAKAPPPAATEAPARVTADAVVKPVDEQTMVAAPAGTAKEILFIDSSV